MKKDEWDFVSRRVPFAEEYYRRLAYEPDGYGRYRLKPNQLLPHVFINEQGYRGSPFTGSESILLLGDSVTFGVGAPSDDDCFSRFLEQATGQQVADASVRAYRLFQHYGQLPKLLGMLPRIRTVLIWFGYADLLYWAIHGGQVEGAFGLESPTGWSQSRALWNRIRSGLGALRTRREAPRESTPDSTEAHRRLSKLVEHIRLYAAAMSDLCRVRGKGLGLLIQPFVRRPPDADDLRQWMDLSNAKVASKCGMDWYAACASFLDLLEPALSSATKIHPIDCQSIVTETDFLDQVHLRPGSLRRIAQTLLQTPLAALLNAEPSQLERICQ
jgi:hypothetical protein